MGKVIVVFILDKFLSALLRLEAKLIVAACRDASVIRGIFRVRNEFSKKDFLFKPYIVLCRIKSTKPSPVSQSGPMQERTPCQPAAAIF
jgi:hypothetical protein